MSAKQTASVIMVGLDKLATFVRILGSRLTEHRIRVHATLLAVGLWSLYAIDLATPTLRDRFGQIKGGDFVHFYLLGSLANRGLGALLYDFAAQSQLTPNLVPDSSGLMYLPMYPPQVSLFFAPFARLPYVDALIVWTLLTVLLYAVSCWLVWRTCARLRSHGTTVVLVALAFPAFFALLAWGQSTAPAVFAFTLAYLALRARKPFVAGLALGLLAYKPSLGVGAAVLFVLTGEWAVVIGALLSASAQIAVGWQYYGGEVMRHYLDAVLMIPRLFAYAEPKPYAVHSLRAFWAMLFPSSWLMWTLYVGSSAVVMGIAISAWKRTNSLSPKYSVLLLASVLVAPHLTIYDLAILAPAMLLLVNWGLENRDAARSGWLPVLLYLCCVLPLLGQLTRWTHLQLSVLAFAGLLYWIWRSATDPTKAKQDAIPA